MNKGIFWYWIGTILFLPAFFFLGFALGMVLPETNMETAKPFFILTCLFAILALACFYFDSLEKFFPLVWRLFKQLASWIQSFYHKTPLGKRAFKTKTQESQSSDE